jgi:hypothetical protein
MTCHGRTVTEKNPWATLTSSSVVSMVARASWPVPAVERLVASGLTSMSRRFHPQDSAATVSAVASGDSIEQMDCERDHESERRHDPDQLAAVLVGLGHHRVREHGEDRTCREGKYEGDGAR